jgi:hypothetical protein
VSNRKSAERGCGGGKKGWKRPLPELIREFNGRDRDRDDYSRFRGRRTLPNLVAAIKTAASGKKEDGSIDSHQRRPHNSDKEGWHRMIETAVRALVQALSRIEDCKNFDALLSVIENVLRESVGGEKKLWAYDVAFRVGAWRGDDWLPCRVYLHRGTREGAEALLGKDKTEGRQTLMVKDFPVELQSLQPWEIEDFLCWYKNEL